MNSFHQGELRDSKRFEWRTWPTEVLSCGSAANCSTDSEAGCIAMRCSFHTLGASWRGRFLSTFSSGLVQTFRIFQTWLTMRSGRFGSDCDWRRFSAAVFKSVHMVSNENVRFSILFFHLFILCSPSWRFTSWRFRVLNKQNSTRSSEFQSAWPGVAVSPLQIGDK